VNGLSIRTTRGCLFQDATDAWTLVELNLEILEKMRGKVASYKLVPFLIQECVVTNILI